MRFSVCIITNVINDLLRATLQSYRSVSDDILLGINNVSEDAIRSLQEEYSWLRVIPVVWEGYGITKNKIADKSRYDWILSVDSDEVATESLRTGLAHFKPIDNHTVGVIIAYNYIGKQKVLYGDMGAEQKKKLYNKKYLRWSDDKVHETLVFPENVTFLKVEGYLNHYTSDSFEMMQKKNDKYAQLSALNYFEKNIHQNSFKLRFAPSMAFFRHYILKKGFLDGALGFKLAREYARYTRLKYSLLRDMYKKQNIKERS